MFSTTVLPQVQSTQRVEQIFGCCFLTFVSTWRSGCEVNRNGDIAVLRNNWLLWTNPFFGAQITAVDAGLREATKTDSTAARTSLAATTSWETGQEGCWGEECGENRIRENPFTHPCRDSSRSDVGVGAADPREASLDWIPTPTLCAGKRLWLVHRFLSVSKA